MRRVRHNNNGLLIDTRVAVRVSNLARDSLVLQRRDRYASNHNFEWLPPSGLYTGKLPSFFRNARMLSIMSRL